MVNFSEVTLKNPTVMLSNFLHAREELFTGNFFSVFPEKNISFKMWNCEVMGKTMAKSGFAGARGAGDENSQ